MPIRFKIIIISGGNGRHVPKMKFVKINGELVRYPYLGVSIDFRVHNKHNRKLQVF